MLPMVAAPSATEQRLKQAQPHVGDLSALHLVDPVPRDDMPDLVTQHPRQLALVGGGFDEPPVHVDEPPGQRERVDLPGVDDGECVGKI